MGFVNSSLCSFLHSKLMIELIEGRIYRVKNFAKYQNIKVEEKVKSEDNVIVAPNDTEEAVKEASTGENYINEAKKADNEDKKSENNVEEETTPIANDWKEYKAIFYNEINEGDNINMVIYECGRET